MGCDGVSLRAEGSKASRVFDWQDLGGLKLKP